MNWLTEGDLTDMPELAPLTDADLDAMYADWLATHQDGDMPAWVLAQLEKVA